MKKIWIAAALAAACLLPFGEAAEARVLKGETAQTSVTHTAQKKTKAVSSSAKNKTAAKTTAKKSTGTSVIEVGLLSAQKEVALRCLSETKAYAGSKAWLSIKKGTTIKISRDGKNVVINGKKKEGNIVLKGSADGAAFGVKGKTYRGEMKLVPASAGGVTVVNSVSMEDYLKGVVPCEVSPSWHTDALRAQAVAARTYAVYHKNGYRSAGYDVTDDTRSQVYGGTASESAATNKAVDDTAGEIVTYNGKAIDAVFHANGGGYTENCENVWGSNTPYLKGVAEESSSVVNKAWTKTVALSDFQKSMGVGKIKKIELSKLKKGPMKVKDRGVSGRVKSFTVIGEKGKKSVTGDRMQSLYGLSSTLFDLSVKGKNLVITGYGSGHGLGLSQWGAEAMAEKHAKGQKDYYKTILTHYFTGTKVEKVY